MGLIIMAHTPEYRAAYRRAENRVIVEFRNTHFEEWRAILQDELNRALACTGDNNPDTTDDTPED